MDPRRLNHELMAREDEFRRGLQIVRRRMEKSGSVAVPKAIRCACGMLRDQAKMPRIPTTGVVKGVVSLICAGCPAERELAKHAKLVCAGCREVLGFVEPGKEKKGGFEWLPGRYYHVPNCPSCKGVGVKSSPVIEKIIFYKERGIPYE